MCTAHVREKREVGPEDKKRIVVSAMAGFPTEGDWHRSPAGHVNEACVFVCLEANIYYFYTREKQNFISWFRFALLWMCSRMVKFTCQQHVLSFLSHLRCWHGYTPVELIIKRMLGPGPALCTHTHTSSQPSTPQGFCPQLTRPHQKLPLEGKHARTANLK